MPTESLIDFFEALCKYRLLVPEQLDVVTRILWPRSADSRALARELIRRDWLTPYQANQLFAGRGDSLVLGQYVLLERLGEGGMGQVFKARHHGLGRVVALKLIRKDRLTSPTAVKRFRQEIQAAARLYHPNVVQAYDADEINGQHFYAMEYVPGTDLAKLLRRSGALPVLQACEYARQAALGLQHAHEMGMIHRDVKPQNLMLTTRPGTADEPLVKVLDLGLALVSRGPDEGEASSSGLTSEGLVMGTADYIAPEQALNARAVDIRADLYSLGCTLFHLLAGRVPFPGGTTSERMLRHHLEQATPLGDLRPGIGPAVSGVVERLMAKKPEDRFETPAAAAAALEEAMGCQAADVPSSADVGPNPLTTTATDGSAAPTSQDTFLSPFADLDPGPTEVSPALVPPRQTDTVPAHWVAAVVAVVVLACLLLGLLLVLI